MGMRDDFRSMAEVILDAFDDVPTTCTYHKAGTFTYNPSTGSVSETREDSYPDTRVLISKYNIEEIDGEAIKVDDRKAFIASNDMPNVTPGVNDYLTIGELTYYVQAYETDPAEAMWRIQLRK